MIDYLNSINPLFATVASVVALLLVAIVADILAKNILLAAVGRIARKTSASWDDALLQSKVFTRLAMVLPVLIVFVGIRFVPGISDGIVNVTRNVAGAWMILMLMLTLTASLSAANWIYEQSPGAKERPIKGFIQLAEMGVYLIGGILMVSALIDRSPVILLSGLGAMTAVLLIVFKDTLLSLAASIQLTSQKMIRVGDWLEIPQFRADGDVIDVALYTVTVQNWDKTITVIPTHRLISDSFKNWRGMQEAGGRRIKRSVFIDVSSIGFLTPEQIEHFSQFKLLGDYIETKGEELHAYNDAIGVSNASAVNLRRLTNIGTFRAYIINYLRNHPNIHKDMTLMVRQLPSGPEGLPMEIYCFTNDTKWVNYEGIQGDIFDHILAIVPEFGLRIFQNPAGSDFSEFKRPVIDRS